MEHRQGENRPGEHRSGESREMIRLLRKQLFWSRLTSMLLLICLLGTVGFGTFAGLQLMQSLDSVQSAISNVETITNQIVEADIPGLAEQISLAAEAEQIGMTELGKTAEEIDTDKINDAADALSSLSSLVNIPVFGR